MIMRNADKQHLIQLDGFLNVKGYVNGMITINKIYIASKGRKLLKGWVALLSGYL